MIDTPPAGLADPRPFVRQDKVPLDGTPCLRQGAGVCLHSAFVRHRKDNDNSCLSEFRFCLSGLDYTRFVTAASLEMSDEQVMGGEK